MTNHINEFNITQEWLDCFNRCKENGDNLAASVFWRMALFCLPAGVNGNNQEVKEALKEIAKSVKERCDSQGDSK